MTQKSTTSFTGSIANPIADTRIASGYSMPQLAKALGLSRQYIQKAEHGIYTSINPSLVKWVMERAGELTPGEIEAFPDMGTDGAVEPSQTQIFNWRYVRFQHATRCNTKENLAPDPLTRAPGDNRPGYAVFKEWRECYWVSVMEFCKAMCLHPETVQIYEDGIRPTMPAPIKKAMWEVQMLDRNWNDRPRR